MTKRPLPLQDMEELTNTTNMSDKQKQCREQMEKKRQREKQRRLEISTSVDRLTKTIVKADPDILNTISSSRSDSDKEFFGVDESPAAAAARPQSASNGSWSSLNRNDVINIACDVIERLNDEVTLLRAEKKAKNTRPLQNEVATTPSDDKELQIISSSTLVATGTSSRDQEEPRPSSHPISSDISDWNNSFNASQYVSSGTSNNVAYDHAMALLVLQQQQQPQSQQHGPVSSFATGGAGGGWATRPTTDGSGSSSSLGARFLQHKAADVSHLQQIRRNDMSQQQSSQHEELLLQQLRYQQSIQEILHRQEISARMHPRVSYHPSSFHAQERMAPSLLMTQPGNAAFAAAGFENAGGLTAASLAVPPVTSFGGISSDDVPPSMYPLYVRKNLQQQGQQGQQGQEGHSFH